MSDYETLFGRALIALESALLEQVEHEEYPSVSLAEDLFDLAESALATGAYGELNPRGMMDTARAVILSAAE